MRSQRHILLSTSIILALGCEPTELHEEKAKAFKPVSEKVIVVGSRNIEFLEPELSTQIYYLTETDLSPPAYYGSHIEIWMPYGTVIQDPSYLWANVAGRISHYNKNGDLVGQVDDFRFRETNCQYLLVKDPGIHDQKIECSHYDEDNILRWEEFDYSTPAYFSRNQLYAHEVSRRGLFQKDVFAQLVGYKASSKEECIASGNDNLEPPGSIQDLSPSVELTKLSDINPIDLKTASFYEYWNITNANTETIIISDTDKPLQYLECRNK